MASTSLARSSTECGLTAECKCTGVGLPPWVLATMVRADTDAAVDEKICWLRGRGTGFSLARRLGKRECESQAEAWQLHCGERLYSERLTLWHLGLGRPRGSLFDMSSSVRSEMGLLPCPQSSHCCLTSFPRT